MDRDAQGAAFVKIVELTNVLEDLKSELKLTHLQANDIIVLRIDAFSTTQAEIENLYQVTSAVFPNHQILVLPKTVYLQYLTRDSLLRLREEIDHALKDIEA